MCFGPIGKYSRIAQLGERQTEDLKVTCSIHVSGIFFAFILFFFLFSFFFFLFSFFFFSFSFLFFFFFDLFIFLEKNPFGTVLPNGSKGIFI